MNSPAASRRTVRSPAASAARARRSRRTAATTAGAKLRMRDLVRESGLPRETIHFYIQQRLLPKAIKTGRNTALYTPEHLERLHRIRELQEKQFLPLRAIRAILDEHAHIEFTPEQEDLVRRLRATLGGWAEAQQSPTVPLGDLVPGRVPREELRELVQAGLVHVHGPVASGKVTEDDAVILECWAQFKEAGLGPERGVDPGEFHMFDHAMEQLVAREARLVMRVYDGAPVEEVSRVVEEAAPIIGRLLSAMHRKRLRRFLAEAGSNGRKPAAG